MDLIWLKVLRNSCTVPYLFYLQPLRHFLDMRYVHLSFLFSELDALRSSDSHCSAEEEHTEGLPGGLGRDSSPVSSSYSELGRGQQQQAGLTGAQLHQLQQGVCTCTLYEFI